MIGSLYSGISGLKANTSALAVIGDNIANVNTTGFKTSSVSFSNVFNATIGQSKVQIGRGVVMGGINADWSTGTLETTSNATDLAINGDGMFVVRDPDGTAQFYTRAGEFEFDNEGYLVTQDGYRVQGYSIDLNGNVGGMTDITMPDGMSAPQATSEITMELNLDSGGSSFETTMTVYDSLGNAQDLTFNFTRDTAYAGTGTRWTYYVTSTNTDLSFVPASGTEYSLVFDSDGNLDPTNAAFSALNGTNADGDVVGHQITMTSTDAAVTSPQYFDWRFLDPDAAATTSDGSLTGYASTSVKNSQTQDGYFSGMLQGISVDEEGVFTGLYSNGTMIPFAQITLADFASYEGLLKQGSNLYSSTLASGNPIYLTAGQGGVGSIASSSLEKSNVDLASEFVDLITAQRAFQANSKVITTSDEVLSELINIKR